MPPNNSDGQGRLLLVIHHWVMDELSWDILLDDVDDFYQQWQTQQPLVLASTPATLGQWGGWLNEYVNSHLLTKEREQWLAQVKPAASSLLLNEGENPATDTNGWVRVASHLDGAKTERLLSQSNQAYRTTTDELLLSALCLAIHQLNQQTSFRFDLQGDNRAVITGQPDFGQTLGRFASACPLDLSLSDVNDIAVVISDVKEHYRAIPNGGSGFAVLRYLREDAAIQALPEAEMVFNGFTHCQPNKNQFRSFEAAAELAEPTINAGYPLSLNTTLSEGRLG
ncbi:MAG: condensation domain-containing protein, partial [Psychrosphaera sp.]|nr:condensation domain-containing protein [Psychrosphaera sp.]